MNVNMMQSLVGEVLKIDRGGPESRIGKLITVGEDYFTLLSKQDGIILYKTHHIKSITQNSKNEMKFNVEIPEDLEITNAPNLKSALALLKYKWIKINRGGKESIEGVLDDTTDDFITLVINEEVVRISMFHIRSISYDTVVEEPKQDESKEEKEEKEGKENKKGKENK